jgi:phosphoribosylformylglycinamidine (FGAM) synthase PurS component
MKVRILVFPRLEIHDLPGQAMRGALEPAGCQGIRR